MSVIKIQYCTLYSGGCFVVCILKEEIIKACELVIAVYGSRINADNNCISNIK